MAFATITFESKSGVVKDAPVGFSWTTLFFWFFPALIRGDWFWAIIIFVASLVFPFIYNRLYIQSLLKNDYEVRNYSGDKARIEAKAQIKLRK